MLPEINVEGTCRAAARLATISGVLPSAVCASLLPSPVIAQSAPSSAASSPIRSATTSAPERISPPINCSAKPRPPAAPAPGLSCARRSSARSVSEAKFAMRPSSSAMRSRGTPFCGPKIAVAPRSPVSGLLTSDITMMLGVGKPRIEAARIDGRQRGKAVGRRRYCAPARIGERETERREQAGAAVVGAAAAQPDHEAANARVEAIAYQLADAQGRAMFDVDRRDGRIGQPHDLRDFEHRSRRLARSDP